MKRILALVLSFAMLFSLAACGGTFNSDIADPLENEQNEPSGDPLEGVRVDLMSGIVAGNIAFDPDTEADTIAAAEFSIQLARFNGGAGENILLSPLSVLCALAMTANGADHETLRQMEAVFGMSVQELNEYLGWYMDSLPQGENYRLSLANAIWVNEVARFTPNRDFLQFNADYYGADIYSAPFDDTTCADINDWVNDKTNGMIPTILDRIPPEALLYLVNALAFEANWREQYDSYQVRENVFTKADGTEQTVEFMYSEENFYLKDENATGFIKMYEDNAYAFVALLPNEGMSPEEYLASLTGEELIDLVNNAQRKLVAASIPKFETGYSIELSEVLKNMGMTDAFDRNKADFSALGTSTEGNLFIGRVLHKTFISVGELGTKAGAATVIEVPDATGAYPPDKIEEVYLDRPFVYLLIDCETGLPFFVGILADAKQ